MDMQGAIRLVTEGTDLTEAEMTEVMRQIMTGEATPAQIGGFLIGLRMKGETVAEITAAARVMRELATRVTVDEPHLLDTCGTGGDASHTLNVSTACAFVAAAGGARVAKHGNRSVSSSCGSADVLEAAGARLDLNADQVAECIRRVGVGFLFAPQHHSAMKHAIGPRREMGVRTLFNILGPLTNPAGAPHQLLGVYNKHWVVPVAETLRALGSRRVLVVHADDGLDEISIGSDTLVAELNEGEIHEYRITPEQFGLPRAELSDLQVGTAEESLALIREAFAGWEGPAFNIIAINAGAALYAAEKAPTLDAGVAGAAELLRNGSALRKLEAFVRCTREV
ncbi:anthranilate phosphoribosyltransferase [Alkalilimnicola ehrlichii MLHE-1]|uniref:Anthranilate phosphoribosyltransferase n=1 Tax=Alkalilimnicola ehrlichii (strain ATCC BAA-1101 / DSM 17681 / MLHE-1) TaxID=187272 RepID=TRPD_ALKEH|nr:anthranilate phosphoribosyltransferase [Alkalilimnicola ehrlichii]Q0A6E7.1 RecName: Full=Anthranilate phosphoribosyltransferase [Alkalilimnicola ehrlichii MLHE-1]ABI57590.1 anthranilate phosphoribosyltransferase [Alkalilimnicola ehrlichii MLHE-1]